MTSLLLRVIPWLALMGVAWFGGCEYQKNQHLDREIGALGERVKARETVIASLAKQKAKVDTQYTAGKTVYVEAVQEWDEIRVTLGEKHPIVVAGDNVRDTCRALVLSCDHRVAIRDTMLAQKDTVIAQKDSMYQAEKKRGGTDWKLILGSLAAGAAVGFVAGN